MPLFSSIAGLARLASFLKTPRIRLALVWCLLFSALAPQAPAQGLSKTLYKDKVNGFRFRPPSKFLVVPSRDDMLEAGVLCRMDHDENLAYMVVARFVDGKLEKDEERDKDESFVGKKRRTLQDLMDDWGHKNFKEDRPLEEKKVKANGNKGVWRTWKVSGLRMEAFSYPGPDADFHLVYFLRKRINDSKDGKKWRSMFSKSGRSFDRDKIAAAVDLSTMDYEDLLRYHKKADAQFKEWRVVGTPSKQFIIKTSSKRGAFVKKVIARLDRSRKLFERDFPPAAFGAKMDAISVVRVCGTEEEFHRYGNTNRGVAGWFNPTSEELVLYSGKKDDDGDDLTMLVMTHEAFHQYCHFLFQRSEAHRWFDEGHGDYYGNASWYKGKVYIKANEKSQWSRLPGAKRLIQNGDMVPLEEHLNFTHREWQSRSVRSYEQSWSIIYMLRKGAMGKVHSKYWKPEYGEIIPNYMNTLLKGYTDEYADELEDREADAKKDGRELTPEERQISRFDLSSSKRNKIWKKAMKASWGKIDLDEFEARWLDYVEHALE